LAEGGSLFRRAGTKIFGPKGDETVAAMWFSLAAVHGVDGAAKRRDEAMSKLSPADRASAQTLMQNWRQAPCTWNQVYGS
jgi:hypothetical protein